MQMAKRTKSGSRRIPRSWVEQIITPNGVTITVRPHGDVVLLRIEKGDEFVESIKPCPPGTDLRDEAKEVLEFYKQHFSQNQFP
jgi:hypothetical protein